MSDATVTILIPTFEPQPQYLRIAIESALKQTFQDFTLLVHDDASKEDVAAIVEPYLKDQRVRFVRSAVRRGIGGNWNASLRHATGAYVQFLFQDDMWEPAYLEKMMAALTPDASLGFAVANHRYLNDDGLCAESYTHVAEARGRIAGGRHEGKEFLHQWIRHGLHPNLIGEPPFVLLRSSLIQKIGRFDSSLQQGLDTEYWVRCLLETDWHFLPEELGTFRVHADAASARNQESGRGIFDRFIILARIIRRLPGRDKVIARSILDHQFRLMAGKFFVRGKKTGGYGGRRRTIVPLLIFAIQHPWLLFSTAVRALVKRHTAQ